MIKRIILNSLIVLCLSSCAYHNGIINYNLSFNPENIAVIKTVYGTSKVEYIFGIGGINPNRLILDAKRNLLLNANLQKNQALTNVIVDNKYFYFIPFYSKHTVYMSADVIEYLPTIEKQKGINIDTIVSTTTVKKNNNDNPQSAVNSSFNNNNDSNILKVGSWVELSDLQGKVTNIFDDSIEFEYYVKNVGFKKKTVNRSKIVKIR